MRESFRRNRTGIALMCASAVLAAMGQLLWKLGAHHGAPMVVAGLGAYGLGALVMVIAYRFGALSVLQPVLSVGYALSLLLGWWVLGEVITPARLAGVAVIMLGVVLLAGSDPGEADRAR